METEKDIWFRLAVWVATLAFVAWAFWIVTGIGGPWFPWIAGLIFVLALVSVPFKAWLKYRSIVWTEEMKDEQRRLNVQQSHELVLRSIPSLVATLGMLLLVQLVKAGVLPQWAGAILLFALLFGWVWLWRVIVRIKV